MKNLKQDFLALAIMSTLVLGAGQLHAQDQMRMSPEQRAVRQTEMMQKNMNLTTDQAEKVKDINLKYAQKNQEIMQSGTNMQDARKQLMQDKETEMRAVLTSDQFAQYQKMQQQMTQRMRTRMQQNNNSN